MKPLLKQELQLVSMEFLRTHFDPANAKSDGANMLHLDYFGGLMTKLVAIRKTVNQF